MSDRIAVKLHHVSKAFRRGSAAAIGFKAAMLHLPAYLHKLRQANVTRVFHDVSLEVRGGECLGVIGRNGSGKSTLLALMAGVLRPNTGTVETHGRICPLLQLGAGFHNELTGQENIMLNGILLGMTWREVAQRRQSIIDFADLGDLIDEPVRTYSSGMVARLGFAVAIHLEPDILLLDEVLAVGDESFQAKCVEKIKHCRDRGAASVFVSHDLALVNQFCDRVAMIHDAGVFALGTPADVLPVYRNILARPAAAPDQRR